MLGIVTVQAWFWKRGLFHCCDVLVLVSDVKSLIFWCLVTPYIIVDSDCLGYYFKLLTLYVELSKSLLFCDVWCFYHWFRSVENLFHLHLMCL